MQESEIRIIRKRSKLLTVILVLFSLPLATTTGNLVQKLVKGFMYIFNAGLYLSFILFLFSKRCGRELKSFVVLFSLSTFFFIVYFLHIEGRYFLAAYPFLSISAAVLISEIFSSYDKVNVT